jgi:hypothetical protein
MLDWKPMEVTAFFKTGAMPPDYSRLDLRWTFSFRVGSCIGTLIVSDGGSCELKLHDASTTTALAQWTIECSRILIGEDGGDLLSEYSPLVPDDVQRTMAG